MRSFTTVLVLATFFVIIIASDSLSQPVMTEDFPPLNFLDERKELKGPSIEIVRNIMEAIGFKATIKEYPWARGYQMVQREANAVLFSMVRSPKREKLFKWVGPIAEKKAVLFAKKGSGIVINDINDAKKVKSIGVQMQYAYEQDLKEKGFKNIDSVGKENRNVRKLVHDRINLWYTDYYGGIEIAKNEKLDDQIELVLTVKKTYLYIAFNKMTPDIMVQKWQNALDKLKKDGTVSKIFDKYNLSTLAPEE